jgi:Skp family chaperone for outer membrane proteins
MSPGPPMSRISTALALALLAATYAAAATATLYKWTDAQGRVVYSDQPPQANVKTEQLRGAPPPANPNAAKELAQREADFHKRQTDASAAAAKAGKEHANSDQRVEACAQAKGQLKQLTESQLALYRYNEKGEREVMDEGARGRERAKLNAWIRDNKC